MSSDQQRQSRAALKAVEALLDELDERARRVGEGGRYAERTPRLAYRRFNLPLRWRHAEGFLEATLHTRNLSVGGLGGVHMGELPLGATATLTLERLDGSEVVVGGTIVHSQRFRDDWWNVGIRFDRPIKLESFVHTPAEPTAGKPT